MGLNYEKGGSLDENKNILMLNDTLGIFILNDMFFAIPSTLHSFPTILLCLFHHLISNDSFFHGTAHNKRMNTSSNQGIDWVSEWPFVEHIRYGSKSKSQVLWEENGFLFGTLDLEILFPEIPESCLF